MPTYNVATAATGVARDAHYVYAPTMGVFYRSLLLEQQRTNLALRSEEFDTWTLTSVTVTANTSVGPSGAATADTIAATTGVTNQAGRNVTFTGDGTKVISCYLKQGTAPTSGLGLFDATAAVTRHLVLVTWAAGVPTLSTLTGTGTLYAPTPLGNGWYRVMIAVDGVVAANTNNVRVHPDRTGTTGTVLAWGAQAEDAVSPSSYIPTAATTVTRNADSCYFDFTTLPQEMTVYVRGVMVASWVTASAEDIGLLHIGAAGATTDPRMQIVNTAGANVRFLYDDGVTQRNAAVGTLGEMLPGNLVEVRALLSSAWVATAALSINNGTEIVGTPATAGGAITAWAGTRLHINSRGTSNIGLFAFTNVTVALGTKTRAEMRILAGVT